MADSSKVAEVLKENPKLNGVVFMLAAASTHAQVAVQTGVGCGCAGP